MSNLQDADEDYYNFIHGGLMTGIISSSDLVRIVFPEHRLRKAVRINIPHWLMNLCDESFPKEEKTVVVKVTR